TSEASFAVTASDNFDSIKLTRFMTHPPDGRHGMRGLHAVKRQGRGEPGPALGSPPCPACVQRAFRAGRNGEFSNRSSRAPAAAPATTIGLASERARRS